MSTTSPLSAEFLYELYATALRQEGLCGILSCHMRKEYLPDRSFQRVQESIASHYRAYKVPPSYAVLAQTFHVISSSFSSRAYNRPKVAREFSTLPLTVFSPTMMQPAESVSVFPV